MASSTAATISSNNKRNVLVPTKRNIEFGSFDDSKGSDSSLQPKYKKDSFSSRSDPPVAKAFETQKDEVTADISEHAIENFLQDVMDNDISNGEIEAFLSNSQKRINRTRAVEEIKRIQDRALSAKSISPQEKQRLIQLALTMDAPKIARQLISEEDAATVAVAAPSKLSKAAQSKLKNKKDNSNAKKEGAFLTGVSLDSGLATYDHCSSDTGPSLGDDQRFYQAIDEVERIRQRILVKAAGSSASAAPSVQMLHQACSETDSQPNRGIAEAPFLNKGRAATVETVKTIDANKVSARSDATKDKIMSISRNISSARGNLTSRSRPSSAVILPPLDVRPVPTDSVEFDVMMSIESLIGTSRPPSSSGTGAVGFPLSSAMTSSYSSNGNTDDFFVIDKYEAFLKPKNEKIDIEKYRGLDNMKFQLNQINMPAPNNGGETPSYFDSSTNDKDFFEMAAPNNFALNSGRIRPSPSVPHVPLPVNTKASHMNNLLSSSNTNAMNTMTTESSSQSHLYLREDNLTRNKHTTHTHHNRSTDMSSSKDDNSSHNMYSISSHSSYGAGPDSNHQHKINFDHMMNNDDTLVHPNLRQMQLEKTRKSQTSNSNSNSVESLGSTMYFVPTRNISTSDHIGPGVLHLDLPRDSNGNNDDNDLTIKPYNVQNKNNLSARKSARNKDSTIISSSTIEESKMNSKFQLNAKMLLSSPLSEWINIGNHLSRQSSYEQLLVAPRDSSEVHRNLSTPKKSVAISGSLFPSDSLMDLQDVTQLNDATIVRSTMSSLQQPLTVSGLFTRPPTASNQPSMKSVDTVPAGSSVGALGRLYGGDNDQLLSVQRLRQALQDLGGHIRSSEDQYQNSLQRDNSGTLSRNNYNDRVPSSSSISSLRRSAGESNLNLQSPSVTVSRHHDSVDSHDTKHFVQPPQKYDQKLSEPNLFSPSIPQKQMGSKRLVALAAALDAGDAVGKLMADMIVSKAKPVVG